MKKTFLEKKEFSFSQISLYLSCPLAFHFCYFEKIPRQISEPALFGVYIHKFLHNFLQKIFDEKHSPNLFSFGNEKNHKEFFEETFLENKKNFEKVGKIKRAKDILEKFLEKDFENFEKVFFLEKSFKIPFKNFFIKGRFDRVDTIGEKLLKVIDYKTGKIPENMENMKLQMFIYKKAILDGNFNFFSGEFYFLDQKKVVEIKFTKEDEEKYEKKIINFYKNLSEKKFPAKPEKNKCKYCNFRKYCKFSC